MRLLLTATLLSIMFYPFMSANAADEVADPCPDMGHNKKFLKVGQDYASTHDARGWHFSDVDEETAQPRKRGYRLLPADVYEPSEIYNRNVYDAPTKERDYMVSPILSIDDIKQAKLQANKLERLGMKPLAAKMRLRIDAATAELFGQKVTDRQLQCLEVAAEIRETAWTMEQHQTLQMAEKYYQRAVDICLKELGDKPKTANAIGDLARLCAEENKVTEAANLYAQALAIYDKFPQFADADMASVLESYASFMERRGNPAAAAQSYARAVELRKRAYKTTECKHEPRRSMFPNYPDIELPAEVDASNQLKWPLKDRWTKPQPIY